MASQSNLWTCPGSVSPPPERSSPSPAPPPTTSSPPHPSSSPTPASSSSFSMQATRFYTSPDTGPFEKYYFAVHHRVGRVLSFFSSRRNWDSPNSSPAGEGAPHRFWGDGQTRWREKGWESPNSDEGHKLWYSLLYVVLCAVHILVTLS
jgi:hypothetical protein